MYTVYPEKGAIVEGLANRNGHRYSKDGTRQHGGARVKSEKLQECKWIHPSVSELKNICQTEFIERFSSSLDSDVEAESESDDNSVTSKNETCTEFT